MEGFKCIAKYQPTFLLFDREKEIVDFWKKNDIFKKSIKNREGAEIFTFFDGPPTANGKPHIGHVLTRAIKDLIPRYRTMKGYLVEREKPAGIPTVCQLNSRLRKALASAASLK